jgi:ATP-dependent helicase HepA
MNSDGNVSPVGCFVRSRTNGLGIGKVARVLNREELEVRYFHNIANIESARFHRSELDCVKRLPQQARCYLQGHDGRWIFGRINRPGCDPGEYEIWLPDGELVTCKEKYQGFWVRCDTPPDDPVLDDPTDALVLGGLDDPIYHSRRHAFAASLIQQRAACRHMSGLVSSRIRILPHQVEVVRRVLEDPIQRYLLADEVGLGKTIEAGAVLRQYLLDEPRGQALILVPRLLVDQWQDELRDRFFLGNDYDANRLLLLDLEEIEEVKGRRFGFVVVDEAQHPAAWAFAAELRFKQRFKLLCDLCQFPTRVLLLSATPARNHERDFLAMLHLLDPILYPLSAVDDFTKRVKQRQAVGHLLLGLQEGAGTFVLGQLQGTLHLLTEQFPQDGRLRALTEDLRNMLVSSEDNLQREQLVRAIRLHVSETYRLHRRLLRNRRCDVRREFLAGRVADGEHVAPRTLVTDLDERMPKLAGWLEDWRIEAQLTLRRENEQDPLIPLERERELANVFRLLVQATGSSPRPLRLLIHSRIKARIDSALFDDLTDIDQRSLISPLFLGERALLRHALELVNPRQSPRPRDRIWQLVRRLKRLRAGFPNGPFPPRCVVFSSHASTADLIQRRIQKALGPSAVEGYRRGMTCEQVAAAIKRFRTESECFALVCDPAAEEGRNLQFADYLIHFDLPLAPNRLEQRIGRLDRLGRTTPFQSWICIGPKLDALTPWLAWYRVLNRAFRIFDNSIASLQFFVDDRLPEIVLDLFRHGAKGLVDQVKHLRNDIEDETTKLDEQDLIDSVDSLDQDAVQFRDKLLEQERKHDQARRSLEQWVNQLAFAVQRNPVDLVRYWPKFAKDDHARQIWWYYKTQVPLDWILQKVIDSNQSFSAVKYRHEDLRKIYENYDAAVPWGSFSREQALEYPGTCVYRAGNRFIEALNQFMHWDDRGRVFAFWRRNKDWAAHSNWVGFRFDYIVSADISATRNVFERYGQFDISLPALQRRADSLLPPLIESIFVERHGKIVTDPQLLSLLAPLYQSERSDDFNLADPKYRAVLRRWVTDDWRADCLNARQASELELMNRGEIPLWQQCAEAADRAERLLADRIEQLALRHVEGLLSGVRSEDIELERELRNVLAQGVRQPRLRLDSLGLIILSSSRPS